MIMIEIFWVPKPATMCWIAFRGDAADVIRNLSMWKTIENLNEAKVDGRTLVTLIPDALEESRLYCAKLEKWDLLTFMRDQLISLQKACEKYPDERFRVKWTWQ